MLNRLTLRELTKQTGIDLKTAFIWRQCFLSSAETANINALSGIIEVDKIFFLTPLKGTVISCIGKLENTEEEE
ncbi:MAG: hypothetical protein ACTS73_03410 [Arsenophonus sp. NEOnobi-MAG3]